ncbi:MAG TPA: Xaa-Pro dipeptidase [Thermoanaerobaculia bacterium]|jgi:Xaa-Pro dipeptidase
MDDLFTLYTAHVTVQKLRHDRAMAELKYDHVVIFSGALHYQFLDDMPYPFKINPHFKVWAPIADNPHCFLVYSPGVKPKLIYFQPVDYWHKSAATPTDPWTSRFDIHMITDPAEAKQYMPRGRTAFIGEWNEEFASWGNFEANPADLLNRLDFDRAWKTEYELVCMRQANVRAARGHLAAEDAFRRGESEYEIHLAYLRAASHTDEELPYGNIIALNHNAAVLHYYHHDRRRLDDDARHSFLIDAGATFNGYASDVTRTYSARKDEFNDLIGAMDRAQQEICAMIAPNVNYVDVHMFAHRKVAELLVEFDFVRDLDAGGILEKRISSTFLPHGVGHLIGVQVHDVGGFAADAFGNTIPKPEGHPFLRLTRVVHSSQVFTIEPGFYFIDPLLAELKNSPNAKYVNWEKVDSFRKFGGIRIEDDVAVTDNGHENLTRNAFAHVS